MPDATTLILDANDSFVGNLYRYVGRLGGNPSCLRTSTDWDEVRRQNPTHLILSPGPGHPKDVALFRQAYEYWRGRIPILGVCLGHQAIGMYCGGNVVVNYRQMHGKTSLIDHKKDGLFSSMPNPLKVMRYHSLVIEGHSLPEDLEAVAYALGENTKQFAESPIEIMAIRHREYPNIWGVQFHPESYFTKGGEKLIANFLAMK